jgi:hypothetical protein
MIYHQATVHHNPQAAAFSDRRALHADDAQLQPQRLRPNPDRFLRDWRYGVRLPEDIHDVNGERNIIE